jgi:acetyl-CoA acetyltransferase
MAGLRRGEVPVSQDVSVVGVGMTPMHRRDQVPDAMAREVVARAMADAGLGPADIGLVVMANALGGRLSDQGCVRGQSWLRGAGLTPAPVVNVDNSCAGGSSALHLGTLAVRAGQSPVLVVGVEKMWTGDRLGTLAGIEDGLPSDERHALHARHENSSGSVLMGLNANWVRQQLEERGTTLAEIAATAVKARAQGARNPVAQFREETTADEVLESPSVVPPLTRLMCSSFTDGAAAVVLSSGASSGAPRVRASVLRSGDGEMDYHDRLTETAEQAWKEAGLGPADVEVVEVHDATSAEELWALEALGFFGVGEAGRATAAGHSGYGGAGLYVNPSGGLVARGHPLGATGLCQVVELVEQLRGRAGDRQRPDTSTAVAVNTGGIMGGRDAGLVAIHVLQQG